MERDSILSQDCYLEKEIEDWSEYLKENDEEKIIRKCSMREDHAVMIVLRKSLRSCLEEG